MTTAAQKTLIARIVKIGLDNRYIQKGGTNTGVGGYKFVQDAAVIDKYGEALMSDGIAVIPGHELRDVKVIERTGKSAQVLTTIDCVFTFTDGVTEVVAKTVGQGMDTGDKGVYKAMTGGRKYAYLQIMQAVTGDDPEVTRDDEKERPATGRAASQTTEASGKPALGKLFAMAKESGIDTNSAYGKKTLVELIAKATGKFKKADLVDADMPKVYAALENYQISQAAGGGEVTTVTPSGTTVDEDGVVVEAGAAA